MSLDLLRKQEPGNGERERERESRDGWRQKDEGEKELCVGLWNPRFWKSQLLLLPFSDKTCPAQKRTSTH